MLSCPSCRSLTGKAGMAGTWVSSVGLLVLSDDRNGGVGGCG